MHPAVSVIIFSTFSGFGLGLLAFIGLGFVQPTGFAAFAWFFLAYAMAVGGLLSSTFHLANPKNAIKSFSQWRSSWLSREAWAAVAALLLGGPYALFMIFGGVHVTWLGWIVAALSLFTVFTTSMIYAQLKTIPRWNTPITPILFLGFAVASGAIMVQAANVVVVMLFLVLVVAQIMHWLAGDQNWKDRDSTAETATGLGDIGTVRLLEKPHSGRNYLTDEMVHKVARGHSLTLRVLTLVAWAIAFFIALVPGLWTALIASVLMVAGMFASRWLFFAEAEHVVGLYYGRK